ncbi:DUF2894 domain-containing protein [Acidovorax sp. sic0104]|uniref:DUF2894 domain-containing protein n=1 Tax=Acidovorax sp. sic0104 TaxID=2854784 RepID=UPI001C46B557|nr:DUF2894 domain-containing protein [Acidovorax sp. sic0104]MBV7540973.1 DUF2894 domain-containing protein [Acidovorax sp. sic0104]
MSETTIPSLKARGADRHDPVRFRYLEAMAERLAAQPAAVQQVLAHRLQRALADYADRVAQAEKTDSPGQAGPHAAEPLAPSPLVLLNRDLDARAQAEADRVRVEGGASASEMKSVRAFSEVWSRISAERQVAQAIDRGPENAGPLNPHRLMLRSLSLMRTLSPDYTRCFLSQMDSLLWLEQANSPRARNFSAPGRTSRARAKG